MACHRVKTVLHFVSGLESKTRQTDDYAPNCRRVPTDPQDHDGETEGMNLDFGLSVVLKLNTPKANDWGALSRKYNVLLFDQLYS